MIKLSDRQSKKFLSKSLYLYNIKCISIVENSQKFKILDGDTELVVLGGCLENFKHFITAKSERH